MSIRKFEARMAEHASKEKSPELPKGKGKESAKEAKPWGRYFILFLCIIAAIIYLLFRSQ